MLEKFTIATFAGREGETFRISPEELPPISTVLVTVTDLSPRLGRPLDSGDLRAPFSVVFRGPMTPVLPQRIYRLVHDELGEFAMFLVPIGPDREGLRYEAVFT
jgi:hypothetical protein